MAGFIREHSVPIVFSVLLHGLVAAALLFMALISVRHPPVNSQPIPIDAVVVDSQVLHAAQRARADEQAAAAAAAAKAAVEAKQAEDAARAADEAAKADEVAKVEAAEKAAAAEKAVAAKQAAEQAHAADLKRAEEAQRVEEEKQAAQAKAAEDAKRAKEAERAAEAKAKEEEDAKRAADQKAKAEADLRRQMAAEEHAEAVQSSPLRDQYIARLQARIQNAWIRPPSARVGLDCLVEVTQLPGGEVTNAQVTQCNGDAVTRESIQNAVYRASPLPSPPDPALFSRTFAFHFHPDQ